MDFTVLGPIRAYSSGRPVTMGGAKPRALLAALLSEPGKPVQAGRLADAIWGCSPPSSARGLVHTYVSGLRRALAAAGHPNLLIRDGSAYLIDVGPEQVDSTTFEDLVHRARTLVDEQRLEGAAQLYRQALALWHGPALEGSTNGFLQVEAHRLDELRITALQERISADIAAGQDRGLIPELRQLAHEYPLRERIWGSLMVCLCRQGRRGEALDTFATADRLLRDELGIEPCEELRRLQHAALNGDDHLFEVAEQVSVLAREEPGEQSAAPGAAGVNQLPPGCRMLVGRTESTATVVELLRPEETASTPSIAVVTGAPGVGKTAFAIHAAQQLRPAFPDGILYADLHGYRSSGPRPAAAVLPGFLRALGVPHAETPSETEEQTALLRTLTESRRILLVLDDVASPEQVRPLLPGSPSCSVLVTSRNDLGGLVASHGADRVRLGPLSAAAASELVELGLPGDRPEAESDAALDVSRLCGFHPLAITTMTAQSSSGRGLADYLRALPGPSRLAALEIPGDERAGVRSSIERSYAALEPSAQDLFRALPLLSGKRFDPGDVVLLTGWRNTEVRRLLGVLAQENLIHRAGHGQYTVDDLLLWYAELLEEPVAAA